MATQLSDTAITELSLVFAKKDGKDWAPRNEEARVLGLKAGEVVPATLLDKLKDAVKGWYHGDPGPITKPKGGDDAGDADKKNQIVSEFAKFYSDLQNAFYVNDEDGRSAAVSEMIENFLEKLDKLRGKSEDTDKAGKRHSSADQAHIDAIGQASAKLESALQAASEAKSAIDDHYNGLSQPAGSPADGPDGGKTDSDSDSKAAAVKAIESWKAGAVGEDGLPVNFAEYAQLCEKAGKKSDKPYGDVEYADPGYQSDGKARYPVDTEEHARAAWSYINKESNASAYSSEDLAKVKAKIKAACEKFGIKLDGDDDSKAGEIDMTSEELNKIVADATAKAATEAAEKAVAAATEAFKTVLAESAKKTEDAKSDAQKATEAAAAAKVIADQAEADAKKARETLAEADRIANEAARKPTAKSGDAEVRTKAPTPNLVNAVKAANVSSGGNSYQSRTENAAANAA
jgi:hypothetical protein